MTTSKSHGSKVPGSKGHVSKGDGSRGDGHKGHGTRPSRGGRDLLSEEDHALWQHTASTLDRARGLKPRVHAAMENLETVHRRPRLAAEPRVLGQAREQTETAGNDRSAPKAAPTNRRGDSVPPLSEVDRKAARRLRSGRIEIEGRLDLHGMRQAEAHSALRAFLHKCHMQGRRWVLVITGKGGISGSGDHETGGWPWESHAGGDRGVLRRNVPRWLAEPDLRPLVVSFREAALRHGGAGALYVQIRNPARESEP